MAKPQRSPEPDEQSVLDQLRVERVSSRHTPRWNRPVAKHHYLKNADSVGEQLRYVATDAQGTWRALLDWSAAALHLKARDQSIEWTPQQRERRLPLLAQNSRFVILGQRQPLPNLASRATGLCLKRLSDDWQKQYRPPIVMVKSFVDRQRFRATAYKASGWEALDPRAWAWLRAQPLPAHLARYEEATPPTCAVETEPMQSRFERFEQMKDGCQPIGKRHRLSTVLAVVALTRIFHAPVEQRGGGSVGKLENPELYADALHRLSQDRL